MNINRINTPCGRRLHLRLLTAIIALLCGHMAYAQQGQIRGTVKDNTGEPLIGATIIEKGTATGTATDFDGNFVLFVKDIQ